jgi:hypothetical protein
MVIPEFKTRFGFHCKSHVANILKSYIFLKLRAPASIMAVLLLQNLLFFSPHWFCGASFVGDFVKPYHATPHYLIQAAEAGAGLDWIPATGMGYPTALNLQSGLFYPPYWLFAIFNSVYSIKAAIFLQCLTILFGALGCSLLCRVVGLTWSACLLGGVIFQSFGGFVTNSMHPDIIRAFALTPWLISPFAAPDNAIRSSANKIALVLMPVLIYMLWTGGYPGNTIALFFTVNIIAVVRGLLTANWKCATLLLFGVAIGTLLAAPSIFPAILLKSEVARVSMTEMPRAFGELRNFFALIYDTDSTFFYGDPTMRSFYIGVPAIALLVSGHGIWTRATNLWLLPFTIIGFVMSTGLLDPLWAKIAPPLLYSRFPISDYKLLMLIPFIVVAASTFDAYKAPWKTSALLLICSIALGNAVVPLYPTMGVNAWSSMLPNFLRFLALITSAVITLCVLGYSSRVNRGVALTLICGVIFLDWARIHWNHRLMVLPDGVKIFNSGKQFEPQGVPFDEQTTKLKKSLALPPAQRPARIDLSEKQYAWRGYYSGEYMMRDWSGPMQFTTQRHILSSPDLSNFAQQPWTAVWVNSNDNFSWQRLEKCDVEPLKYGTDKIVYRLRATSPGTYVVNETYFPGWVALATDLDTQRTLKVLPKKVDGFRGYEISAGTYEIVESFDTPHRFESFVLAALGLCFYIGFVRFVLRKQSFST